MDGNRNRGQRHRGQRALAGRDHHFAQAQAAEA